MNPILVDVLRGESCESCHRGALIALNADGKTVLELGDTDALVFPRSSLKPLQAIPLVESGACDKYAMTEQELALACASHSGEEIHRQVLSQWMQRIGLSPANLECGPALPFDKEAAEQLLRSGGDAAREIHNCSGKHTGMLTMAAFLEQPLAGYSEYGHVTQQGWMTVLSEVSGINIFDMPWDKDGCGLPAIALPLAAFAKSFVPFLTAHKNNTKRSVALSKISNAMRAHPVMVAGSNRCCTGVMTNVNGLMAKTGAEGVFIAAAIESGIVIALKADDGANRAAEAMLGAALRHLGLIDATQYENMRQWFSPPIINSQQAVVGFVAPSKVWNSLNRI